MANHKSAKKRAKQNIVKRDQNRVKLSRTRTLVKKFQDVVKSKNAEAALTLFKDVQSSLAKLGRSKVLKSQNASRRISRLADLLNKLK